MSKKYILKKWSKRMLKFITFTVILFLVLLSILQMPMGKRLLSDLLSAQLSRLSAETIHVGTITGFVPFTMSIDYVEIEDPQGQWLSIRNLSWHLSPIEMAFGRLTFQSLGADSMDLSALPQSRVAEENLETALSIPEIPSWLTIKEFAIDQININEEVFGRSTSLMVRGSLVHTNPKSGIKLSLYAHDLQESDFKVAFLAEKQDQSISLNASLYDGVYLPERLNISDPISIQLTGAGLMTSWTGDLRLSIGDEKIGAVTIEYEKDHVLKVKSIDSISLTNKSFPSFVSDLLGSETSFEAMINLAQTASEPSSTLSLLSSVSELNLSGSFNIKEQSVNGNVTFTHFQPSGLSDRFEIGRVNPTKLMIEIRGTTEELHSKVTAWSAEKKLIEGDVVITASSQLAIRGDFITLANTDLWPKEFQSIFSDSIELSFDLNYDQESDRIVVQKFDISTIWAKFSGTGSSTWKEKTIVGTVNASINDLERMTEFLGIKIGGRVALNTEIHGTVSDFHTTTLVTVHEFNIEDLRISSFELELEAQGKDWIRAFDTPVDLRLKASSDPIQINEKTQPRIELVAEGTLSNIELLTIDEFSIHDQNTYISGNAHLNFQSKESTVNLKVHSNNIVSVTSLFGNAIGGKFDAALQVESEAGVWHGALNMQLDDPYGFPRGLSELAGHRLRADIQGTLLDDVITINSVDWAGQYAQLTGTGRYQLESREGTMHGKITVPDLGILNSENNTVLSGHAIAEGTINSSGEQFDANLKVSVVGGRYNEHEIEMARALIEIKGNSSVGEGMTHISVTNSGETIEAASAFNFDSEGIVIPEFMITNRDNVIEGNAKIAYRDSTGRFEIAALIPDLSSFEPFIGIALQGSIDGDAEFGGLGDARSFNGQFKVHNFSTKMLTAGLITTSWELDDVLTSPQGHLNISGSEIAVEQIAVQKFEFSGNLNGGVSNVEIEASGELDHEIPWNASAYTKLYTEEMRINLERLHGNIDQYPFQLEDSTTISFSDQRILLNPTKLRVGDGTIEAKGVWSENLLDVHTQWKSISLSILESFGFPIAQGSIDGSIVLSGTPEVPQGEMSIQINNFRTHGMMHQSDLPSVFASSEISLSNDTLTIDSTLDASSKNAARIQLTVPAKISFSPFKVEESTAESWSGSIHYNADIDLLPALLNWDGTELRGQIEGDFEIHGSMEHPQLNGKTTLNKGRFEHAKMGSAIENISIELVADGDALKIMNATATDDAGGRLTANGKIQLQPDRQFPFHFDTEVTNMSIVYQDDITSSIDGSIGIAGNLDDMEIVGDLRLGPTTIILRPDESTTVVELAVLELNGDAVNLLQDGLSEPQSNPVRLNISVTVPGRAFILATDMRTEWQGQFTVGGTTLASTLEGELKIVQGYIAILGRRFTIEESESVVIFDKDTSPPMPYFNITASASREGITARVTIQGSQQEMTMDLTSDPVMPIDEILSLLLFGRSVAQITPVQALQLARAAALFSGSAKGLPFFSGPSRIKGIDTFDVKMGDEVPVVGVGKYLADGVFLEIEQGAGAESSRARVEIDLLPTLKLQTSVGGNSQGGIGLFWKRDY